MLKKASNGLFSDETGNFLVKKCQFGTNLEPRTSSSWLFAQKMCRKIVQKMCKTRQFFANSLHFSNLHSTHVKTPLLLQVTYYVNYLPMYLKRILIAAASCFEFLFSSYFFESGWSILTQIWGEFFFF